MSVLHTNINEVVSLFVTEHGVTIITYQKILLKAIEQGLTAYIVIC